ncbi:hypothetical protein VIBNISOn1_270020 [Vibrio nigripulchritudo SOn1]|uniref:Transposase n=1 Tax=Vibrio nigripulchritudo SOn1 TaxID=1238450 RepID=A0AAV2VR85_9VIBR|nr:hypothetical protein VIBNISOn1_270020 [Vibrio nigripulchritudo SOn1]
MITLLEFIKSLTFYSKWRTIRDVKFDDDKALSTNMYVSMLPAHVIGQLIEMI